MSATATSLRNEMMMGTLESIFLTSTKISTIIIAYTIFGSIFGFLSVIILYLVGFFLFDIIVFSNANIFTLIIFILSIFLMMGFGMIFTGLALRFKNIGSAVPLFQSITMFFCGVYFPITVLPNYLQTVAKFVPFYYSIEGMRISLIPGTATSEILSYIVILIGATLFFALLGIFILYKGLTKAKKDGSLAFY